MPDDIRFLVDTQLPPSLANFFRQRGYGATHVVNYPSGALMQDDEIITIAQQEKRIIVTKDRDFFDYFILNNYPPAVLLLQLGNIRNPDLIAFMDNNLDKIRELFEENIKRLVAINRDKIVIY